MVRIENIETKLSALRGYLIKLKRYQAMPIETISADQDLSGATERYLFLAAQAAIDAAEMTCKLKGLQKPESMVQAIEVLRIAGCIDDSLCSRLVRMVGFRNVLSHGYENLDYSVVAEVLYNRLTDLECFAKAVEHFLKEPEGGCQ